MIRKACVSALVGLLCGAGAVFAAPQSKDQQLCITKLNKNALKVATAQAKANSKCVAFAGKGKLAKLGASDAKRCLYADAKGKVAKKSNKTLTQFDQFCTESNDVPDFGLPVGSAAATNGAAAVANRAAAGTATGLLGDIFGPSLGVALVDCESDPAGCKCQAKVAKDVEKLLAAQLKEYVKCKKFALSVGKLPFAGGATSPAELAACVGDPLVAGSIAADSKQKIERAFDKLAADLAGVCADTAIGAAEPFPGVCTGLNAAPRAACARRSAACRACEFANRVDGLAADCDDFDDGIANASCPGTAIAQQTVDIPSAAEPDGTPGSAGVVVSNPKLLTHFGGGADLNKARYTRYHWADNPAPDAILILVPGFEGGAGDFKILAENLLVRARARNDQVVEVWGYDRRTNQLEDTAGLDIAEDLLDPMVGLDWLFGAELGLPLHPALSSGPGRRALFYNTSSDIPFLANWTPLVFSQDIDAVVAAAHAAVGNGNVFLGGHSAGTGFTARYAATDFDLSGAGPADPGYAKLRGLVLLEGGGGSTAGTPPSSDALDRIEAKFDGGLFGAVRDAAPRCVDGITACTVASEAADCAAFANTKCTPNVTAYSVLGGLLNPKILAAVEPAALQGVDDPDGGQILLQVDFGSGTAISTVPELLTLGVLPQATVFGGIGAFIDDDGAIAGLASFVATSVGAAVAGPPLQTWQDVNEGPPPPAAVPNNGAPPVLPPTPPATAIWGQEKEVTDFSRMLGTFYAGGTNFTDWYYPSSGLSVTGGLPSLDSSALSLDPPAGRGRRDIENLTQAAAIDIPVIAFGGSNGLAEIPAEFLAFAQSIAPCAAASCDGSTPRVVDPSLPNPAFPTYGGVAGGFEVHMNEGFAHVDVLTAEDDADNDVVGPLADFLLRNAQ